MNFSQIAQAWQHVFAPPDILTKPPPLTRGQSQIVEQQPPSYATPEEARAGVSQELRGQEDVARRLFLERIQRERAEATTEFGKDLWSAQPSAPAFQTELSQQLEAERVAQEAEIQKAREQFEVGLPLEEAKVKGQIAAREAEVAKQLALQEAQALGRAKVTAKREYMMRYRRQLAPQLLGQWEREQQRLIAPQKEEAFASLATWKGEQLTSLAGWRKEQLAAFKKQTASTRTGLEAQLAEWQLEQKLGFAEGIKKWREEQLAGFQTDIAGWEAAEKSRFESDILGWKTEALTELESGITKWQAEQPPPALATQMLGYEAPYHRFPVPTVQVKTPKGVLSIGFDIGKFLKIGAEQTVYAGAGIVGGVESFAYGVGRLIGLETPAPPVTAAGAFVSSGIQSIGAGQLVESPEMAKLKKYGMAYAAATLLPDVLIPYGIGKGMRFVTQPVTSRVSSYLGKTIGQTRPAQWIVGQVRRPTEWMGYQFRQHAPKPLLRLAYGQRGASIIDIERTWGWGWSGEELKLAQSHFGKAAQAILGTPEAVTRTGMPFYRQQTLWGLMPTKEWQTVGWLRQEAFVEAPRRAIEAQLTWGVGIAPSFGISAQQMAAETVHFPEGLPLREKMMLAESIQMYKPERLMKLSLEGGQLKQTIHTGWSIPTGEKTRFTIRGAFEFEQSTKMLMPSRLFVGKPAETALLKSIIGTATTPFETTLKKAMMGGHPAIISQLLTTPASLSLKTVSPILEGVPTAPVRAATAKVTPVAVTKPFAVIPSGVQGISLSNLLGIGVGVAARARPSLAAALKVAPIAIQAPVQAATQVQVAKQVSVQALNLRSLQVQTLSQQLLQVTPTVPSEAPAYPSFITTPIQPPLLTPPFVPPRKREDLKKRKKKRKLKIKKGWALRHYLYPVRGVQSAASYILGKD